MWWVSKAQARHWRRTRSHLQVTSRDLTRRSTGSNHTGLLWLTQSVGPRIYRQRCKRRTVLGAVCIVATTFT